MITKRLFYRFSFILHPFNFIQSVFGHFQYRYHRQYTITKEMFFIVSIIIIYLISSLVQFSIIPIFDWPIIKSDSINEFFFSVFQIQATIATLGVAIIALLSGLITTKYYGITVTDFILNKKPIILKHKLLAMTNISSIALNYVFCSMSLYNLVSATLISSVLICLKMSSDIYYIFSNGADLQDDVHSYIFECLGEKYLYETEKAVNKIMHQIVTDMNNAISYNDNVAVLNDSEIITEIIGKYLHRINTERGDTEYFVNDCCGFVRNCRASISKLLDSNNDRYVYIYIDCLIRIYREYTLTSVRNDIFDDVSEKMYYAFSIIDPIPLFHDQRLQELRAYIYDNLTENKESWYYIIEFLSALYESFLLNRYYIQLSTSAKQNIWIELVKATVNKTDYHQTRFLSEPRKRELNKLLKAVIKQNDIELLNVIFPLSSEYECVNLSITACIYNASHNSSIDSIQKEKYKSILFQNAYGFHCRYLARDSQTLKENCRYIIYYIIEREDFDLDKYSFVHSLNFYEKEFLFFYVLLHIDRVNDINDIINCIFKRDMRNLYNCFYFKGDTKLFIQKFNEFTNCVLGNWYFDKKMHISKVLDFCMQYFQGYNEEDDDN